MRITESRKLQFRKGKKDSNYKHLESVVPRTSGLTDFLHVNDFYFAILLTTIKQHIIIVSCERNIHFNIILQTVIYSLYFIQVLKG